MRSDQRVAVITGGASGIGWALAQKLVGAGYTACILDLDEKAAAQRARELGPHHHGCACDVSDTAQVDRVFAEVNARFRRLDLLVNNAGITGATQATIDQDMAHFDRITRVIINGTFNCSRAAHRAMAGRGGGVIINVGSIAGLVGLPRRNAYGAAKAGVHSLTRALACEWASVGIRVNAVAPGYIATPMVNALIERGAVDVGTLSRRIPMGRLGTADEVADTILFLASDGARYITGSILSVDGGWAAFGDSGNASIGRHQQEE